MPHAALWVVQLEVYAYEAFERRGFNAARGFVGGAATMFAGLKARDLVSMPHAALWVVQLRRSQLLSP